jgi:uncharacterized protein (TIGR02466 family)
MQVLPIYPVLVYQDAASFANASSIKSEIDAAIDDLKSKNQFQRKRPNEHLVSDVTFSKNFVQDFNLVTFQQEALTHAIRYMQLIGRDTSREEFNIFESWATITEINNYSPKHEHGFADIAGVYYHRVGNSDSQLYFSTPVKQCQMSRMFAATHPDMSVKPTDGMFLLFPGWLEHGVSAQTTNDERISIAFNIKVTKQKKGT